jgi:hypothetical protein
MLIIILKIYIVLPFESKFIVAGTSGLGFSGGRPSFDAKLALAASNRAINKAEEAMEENSNSDENKNDSSNDKNEEIRQHFLKLFVLQVPYQLIHFH